jgi:hypothetical protein
LFWSALRRWAERALSAGVLTIADIKNGDLAACTLPGPAISPPPVSQGRVQPGEVLDAAEIVEDKLSKVQLWDGVDTVPPLTSSFAAELSDLNPPGAQPGTEPTQPFEVDPARLWGPRLSLYRRWRMWMSEWGPRPDQDGCLAPDYLL